MSWVLALKNFTNDTVRQVQFFVLCRQLGIILSSVVVAWFLPVKEVGILEMLIFAGYLMTFFWTDAILRGYLANKKILESKDSNTSLILLYFLGSLLVMALLLAGQKVLLPILTSRTSLEGLALFAFYQALIIPVWISPYTGILKGQNILLLSLFVLIGPAFSCWTGYASYPGLEGILIGLVCYALVGFLWLLTKLSYSSRLQITNILLTIWPATWPLVLYAISSGLARSFDAWLVARNFDESIFAIFRYGAREFPLVIALSMGLSLMMISKLHDNQSLGELKGRSTRLMHLCYPFVFVLMLSSPLLFTFLFGQEYKMSAAIFNIYLLVTLTQLIFPQSVLTARGDTKLLWQISLGELAMNIIASIILLQYMGISGIVWGTLIAFVFEKILLLIFVWKRYQINVGDIIHVPVWTGYIVLVIISFIFSAWVFGM